jgi:alkylation response protein AidB-like acyl-CoA dehydrogenase
MDFSFTSEQKMLLETTQRFLQDHAGLAAKKNSHASVTQSTDPLWQGLTELGLLALNIPSAYGGLDCGAVETMLVMQAAGEHLLLAPLRASAVVSATLIAQAATSKECEQWLPAIAEGSCIIVLAHDERHTQHDRFAIQTTAVRKGSQLVLQGQKCMVAYAPAADVLLVTALLEGQLRLLAVPTSTPGLKRIAAPMVDGCIAADVILDEVILPDSALLGDHSIELALGNALDRGLAAACAEAVGIFDKLQAACAEYLNNRVQFGVPIASFQVLRHRMAEMLIHLEQARSMSYLAAVKCDEPDLAERDRALSAAKVVVGQASRFIGQQAVQLHGGMGVTDELIISHYFKRLMVIEMEFGSTDHHLQKFAAAIV